jgi:hypothetical protein
MAPIEEQAYTLTRIGRKRRVATPHKYAGFWPFPAGTAALPIARPAESAAGPETGSGTPATARDRLGPPLDITAAASLIGCSPWSVRYTLIPRGLPHFRSGASGKLIFYTNQIIRWIEQQQKGGFR